jgi:hypothetical protein
MLSQASCAPTPSSAEYIQLFQQLTIYLGPPFSLFTCRECRTALPFATVPYHFSHTAGHAYSASHITRILQAWIASPLSLQYPTQLITAADARAWTPPTTPQLPIPGLPILSAYACRLLDYTTGRRCTTLVLFKTKIQAHCKHVHGWINPSPRGFHGRALAAIAEAWETEVPCQRLAGGSTFGVPWRILSLSPTPSTATIPATSLAITTQERAWQALEARLETASLATQATLPGLDASRYPVHHSAWLEKTGWLTYLAGHNLPALANLLQPPTAEEPGLTLLLQTFDCAIKEAQTAILTGVVNTFALHRANSFRRSQSFSKPLRVKLLSATYKQYQLIWHRLLTFVYRLAVLSKGPKGFAYTLTPAQQQALDYWQALIAPPATLLQAEEIEEEDFFTILHGSPSSQTSSQSSGEFLDLPPSRTTTPPPPSSPLWPSPLAFRNTSGRPSTPLSPPTHSAWVPKLRPNSSSGFYHSSDTPTATPQRPSPSRYRLRRPCTPLPSHGGDASDSHSEEDSAASHYSPSPSPPLLPPSRSPYPYEPPQLWDRPHGCAIADWLQTPWLREHQTP